MALWMYAPLRHFLSYSVHVNPSEELSWRILLKCLVSMFTFYCHDCRCCSNKCYGMIVIIIVTLLRCDMTRLLCVMRICTACVSRQRWWSVIIMTIMLVSDSHEIRDRYCTVDLQTPLHWIQWCQRVYRVTNTCYTCTVLDYTYVCMPKRVTKHNMWSALLSNI